MAHAAWVGSSVAAQLQQHDATHRAVSTMAAASQGASGKLRKSLGAVTRFGGGAAQRQPAARCGWAYKGGKGGKGAHAVVQPCVLW